jgi:ubiquinone/menaquinone biosynthesis C-methylase UbiE
VTIAALYDAINALIFLPSGGSGRLRQVLVDALDVRSTHRVLELGCGTGQVTRRLTATGADVVALDALPAMLAAARRRAPRATFIEGDALQSAIGDGYDRVVLAFVLHNFEASDRRRLLTRAATALGPHGRIGILDWALPRDRLRAAVWRRFLRALEPSGTGTRQILEGGLEGDALALGLRVVSRRPAAGGRAQIVILEGADRLRTD